MTVITNRPGQRTAEARWSSINKGTFIFPFRSLLTPSLLLVALSGCVPQEGPPASAADVAALQQRIDSMTKRITTLEQAVAQSSKTVDETEKMTRQSRADQSVLIEDLRSELKSLKGQLEVSEFDSKK